MKRHYVTISLILLTVTSIYGQTNETLCDCPETEYAGTKVDTTYHLSNGKTIVLCGYKHPDSKPTVLILRLFFQFADKTLLLTFGVQHQLADCQSIKTHCLLTSFKTYQRERILNIEKQFGQQIKYISTDKMLLGNLQLTDKSANTALMRFKQF